MSFRSMRCYRKAGKKHQGGNAIAVQNLNENSAMLLMLGIYSLAVMIGIGRAHWHWLRCAVCAGNNGAVDLASPSLIFNAGFGMALILMVPDK